MSLDEGERIARETSNVLDQEEKRTVNAVNRILEESYNQLEKKFTKEYDKAQKAGGSLFKQEQAAFALDQIGDAVNLLPGKRAEKVRKEYRKLLKTAQEKGIESGERLAQTVSPDGVDDFAKIDVNIEAIKSQAKEGVKRLKNHTESFRNRVNTLVGANLAMGSSPRKAAQQLRKEFAVTKDKADMITRTESMSALNDATNAFYEENEINYVLRIETEDKRTCPFCIARAGKIYKVSEKPGLAHPRCRVFYMPTSPRWHNQKDLEWAGKHRREVKEANPDQSPNYNPTPFERASGTELNPVSQNDFLSDVGESVGNAVSNAAAAANQDEPEPEPEPESTEPTEGLDPVSDSNFKVNKKLSVPEEPSEFVDVGDDEIFIQGVHSPIQRNPGLMVNGFVTDKEKFIEKHGDQEIAEIEFTVNDDYDTGTIEDPKQAVRVGMAATKNSKKVVLDNYRDGDVIVNSPNDNDNSGNARARLYKRVGFKDPDEYNYQYAVIKDGKIQGVTSSELEQILDRGTNEG
jgi:SPP1 gp7 family putative phage head morphogenesis protein